MSGDPAALPADSGIEIDIPQHEAKPIAMACPQCGGGLTITADDDRTIPCRFCEVEVFLPDELWRRLHPVATMSTWTLTWLGPELRTVEQEAEQAREAAEEQARIDAAAGEVFADTSLQEPLAPVRSGASVAVLMAVIGVIAAAGVVFALALMS